MTTKAESWPFWECFITLVRKVLEDTASIHYTQSFESIFALNFVQSFYAFFSILLKLVIFYFAILLKSHMFECALKNNLPLRWVIHVGSLEM